MKRIEYRARHLRASRTGGVALRAQTRAAGINLTANTARGTRVSTRLAKGTQGAFQNGRFILRGRYGDGPTKLNLSKSGVSVSTKTEKQAAGKASRELCGCLRHRSGIDQLMQSENCRQARLTLNI